jgi:pyrroloquinoline-quinone synthase
MISGSPENGAALCDGHYDIVLRAHPSMLTEIEDEVLRHPILEHPFLRKLATGKFAPEQIAVWISQQFYFSTQFPRCLAALYARIDDFQVSKPLMSFLSVEHWGSNKEGAHWKQFRKTLEFFGFGINDLRCSRPLPETCDYLDFRLNLCLQRTVEEGLGAIAFGHELINERIFKAYLDGMVKIPSIPEDALTYFRMHVTDEPEDYQLLKQLMLARAMGKDEIDLLRRGAEEVLSARYTFFDKILGRVESPAIQDV